MPTKSPIDRYVWTRMKWFMSQRCNEFSNSIQKATSIIRYGISNTVTQADTRKGPCPGITNRGIRF